MKFAMILSALIFSTSVLATDFYAHIESIDCSIVNGLVTRTYSFGKETIGSSTQTKNVKLDGLAPYVRKAIAATTQATEPTGDYSFTMVHEGKTYVINYNDSYESQALTRMISDLCR